MSLPHRRSVAEIAQELDIHVIAHLRGCQSKPKLYKLRGEARHDLIDRNRGDVVTPASLK